MDNKRRSSKVSKLLILSTVTVSSVVSAVNPIQGEAAPNAKSLVEKAEKYAKSLKKEISYEYRKKAYPKKVFDYPSAKLVKQTATALKDAEKAVKRLKGKERKVLEAKLSKNVKTPYKNALKYVDAVKAGKSIESKAKAVQALLDQGLANKTTVKKYQELADTIKKNTSIIQKVSDKSMRNGLTNFFVKPANQAKDNASYAISIQEALDSYKKELSNNNFDAAVNYLVKIELLYKEAKDKGLLALTSKIGLTLFTQFEEVNAKYNNFMIKAKSTKPDQPTVVGGTENHVKVYSNSIVIVAGKGQHIKLANAEVKGNIIIKGDQTGSGSVYLDNVTVANDKEIIVHDVADHTLVLQKVKARGLNVHDPDGANIIANTGTKIGKFHVGSGAARTKITSNAKGAIENLEIATDGTKKSSPTTLDGDFSESNVEITGDGSDVTMGAQAILNKLSVRSGAKLSAQEGARINQIDLAAKQLGQKIELHGKLKNTLINILNANANISVGAGAEIGEVKKDPSVTGPISITNNGKIDKADGVDIKNNPPATNAPPPGGGGGGGSGPSTPSDTTAPTATIPLIGENNSASKLVYTFSEPLYVNGAALADGADVKEHFQYDGTDAQYVSAVYNTNSTTTTVTLTFDEPDNNKKITPVSNKLKDKAGNVYQSNAVTFQSDKGSWEMEISIKTVFDDGKAIPAKYSVDGGNTSLPVAWNPIEGAESYALIMYDTHPEAGGFVHWVVKDIDTSVTSIGEGISRTSTMPGVELNNYFAGDPNIPGKGIGYGGPMPPSKHTYKIVVYALNSDKISLDNDNFGVVSRENFEAAIAGKVISKGEISGTFTPDLKAPGHIGEIQGSRGPNTVTLSFSPAFGAEKVWVEQSVDNGQNWVKSTAVESLNYVSSLATITGLIPNTKYTFKVVASKESQTLESDKITVTTTPKQN